MVTLDVGSRGGQLSHRQNSEEMNENCGETTVVSPLSTCRKKYFSVTIINITNNSHEKIFFSYIQRTTLRFFPSAHS